MPYAAKAIIQHEYEGTTLQIWITFCSPMKLSTAPLDVPVIFDVKPPDTKWLVYLDTVLTAITSSEWLDLYTMLLTIESVGSSPNKVTVAYDGPDPDLRTVWNKQWEPWAIIESYTGWPTDFKFGMIILWHGSVVSIPSGWHICDGTVGTPDLRGRFILGCGAGYDPGDTGDTIDHFHHIPGTTETPTATQIVQAGTGATVPAAAHKHDLDLDTESTSPNPPFYALAYIMKL